MEKAGVIRIQEMIGEAQSNEPAGLKQQWSDEQVGWPKSHKGKIM